MIKLKVFVVFFISIFCVVAQSQQLTDADIWFDAQDYCKAKPLYAGALKNKPYDALLNYKYGSCLYHIGESQQAIKPLELAAHKVPIAGICLGDINYDAYKFAAAKDWYKFTLDQTPQTDINYSSYQIKLERSDRALQMLSSVEEVLIVDSFVVNKINFFTYYNLSKDAGRIFPAMDLTANTRLPYTGFIPERGDRMFYVDTLRGKSDIYQTNKLLDGWSEKQSVSSSINTSYNENFPFLMSDGITLYFASDNPTSIGGYDIFVTRFRSDTNDYLTPENVGMPFNSPYNDYLMVLDEEAKMGWFASDRFQQPGKVIIYKFKLRESRSVIQTDDEDQRIRFAQLKEYKKWNKELDSVDLKGHIDTFETSTLSAKRTINFVINDTLIYHSTDDFKSDKALTLYLKGAQRQEKLDYIKKLLEDKRGEYALVESEDERKRILSELQGLELELTKDNEEPKTYFKDARNIEIHKILEIHR